MTFCGLTGGFDTSLARDSSMEPRGCVAFPGGPSGSDATRQARRTCQEQDGNQQAHTQQRITRSPVHDDPFFPESLRIESISSFARIAIGLKGSLAMKIRNCSSARSFLPSFILEMARLKRAWE